jgi:hypothetical protein
MFHFGSDIIMEDIHEFMDLLAPDYFDSFVLCEWNDSVSVMMDEEMSLHLFDLDNDTDGVITVPSNSNHEMGTYDEDDEEDIVTLLLKEVKKGLTVPTLDQLLDKITENGVNSLTPYEKGVLETYSQK